MVKKKKDTPVKLFPTRLPVERYPLLRVFCMSFQNWRSQGLEDELDGAGGRGVGRPEAMCDEDDSWQGGRNWSCKTGDWPGHTQDVRKL